MNLAAESTSCTWELVWKPRQARANKEEDGTTAYHKKRKQLLYSQKLIYKK